METTRFLNGIVKYMTFIDISNVCCLYCIKLLGSQHKLDSVSYLLRYLTYAIVVEGFLGSPVVL
jgi:hypothetical protein